MYQHTDLSTTSAIGAPPAASPARAIPIRLVPRAAIAALVARLIAEGVQHGG